ncbi:hypothetical protein E2320_013109 [Naja naja]|nr:hypothetical protein E2320_013109 [Naja naja]
MRSHPWVKNNGASPEDEREMRRKRIEGRQEGEEWKGEEEKSKKEKNEERVPNTIAKYNFLKHIR